jgi:hypothetical protein
MAGGTIDVPSTVSVPSGIMGVAPKTETELTPVSTSIANHPGSVHFADEFQDESIADDRHEGCGVSEFVIERPTFSTTR